MPRIPAVHSAALIMNDIFSSAVFKAVYISTIIQRNVLITHWGDAINKSWCVNHFPTIILGKSDGRKLNENWEPCAV